jgi:amino acid permease
MANSFGLNIIFFNVFGEVLNSVINSFEMNPPHFMRSRAVWIIMLALLLLPLVLKKQLTEL